MKIIKAVGIAGALLLSSLAVAEAPIAIVPTEGAAPVVQAPAEGAAAPVVKLSAEGDHVVKVNTGNETADALGNLASKCAERTAAFKTCDSMGGFKAMGCRKMAEFRYKEPLDCPQL
ncbi:MAG: hypothetical protein REI12_00415 [Pedobacter sp.]|nr:hypothetical protein [Pedobacter sp.]